ncbi:MAG: TlpA family protein disulfide reductase [Actinobacteria bacterium]|nr:TlpA family protein disulfide reductase [Actinomycetota bacterium]
MKKISFLLITTLLLSGCASSTKVSAPGIVASCDQIKLLESADKSVLMGCLDGSSEINFHQLKGPLLINVWGSWCEGCKQEMPYFVELYQNPLFKNGQIQMLGINVEEKSKDDAINYIQKSGMSWPNLEDSSGISKSIFGPGVPVTWFIDANGKTVESKIGAYTNKKQLFNQVENAFGVKL